MSLFSHGSSRGHPSARWSKCQKTSCEPLFFSKLRKNFRGEHQERVASVNANTGSTSNVESLVRVHSKCSTRLVGTVADFCSPSSGNLML